MGRSSKLPFCVESVWEILGGKSNSSGKVHEGRSKTRGSSFKKADECSAMTLPNTTKSRQTGDRIVVDFCTTSYLMPHS